MTERRHTNPQAHNLQVNAPDKEVLEENGRAINNGEGVVFMNSLYRKPHGDGPVKNQGRPAEAMLAPRGKFTRYSLEPLVMRH